MAKQQIKTEQFNMMVNGTLRKGCFFKSGTTNVSINGDIDFNVTTGVSKFPNGMLAFGVMPGWTSVTWNQSWRAGYLYEDATEIRIQGHAYASPTVSKEVHWWALGY